MSHGVTENTAGLNYSGESGGLNEATSDIFGTAVEFYANNRRRPRGDYLIGEKIDINGNGTPLRYMDKPSKDGRSADCWSTDVGRLDVHYSSGPAEPLLLPGLRGHRRQDRQRRQLQQPDLRRRHRRDRRRPRDVAEKVWYRTLDDQAHLEQRLRGGPQRGDRLGQGALRQEQRAVPGRAERPSPPSGCRRAPRPAPTSRSLVRGDVLVAETRTSPRTVCGASAADGALVRGQLHVVEQAAGRGRQRVAALGLAEVDGPAVAPQGDGHPVGARRRRDRGRGGGGQGLHRLGGHRAVDGAVRVVPVTRPSGATASRSSNPATPPVRRRSVADAVPPGAVVVPGRVPVGLAVGEDCSPQALVASAAARARVARADRGTVSGRGGWTASAHPTTGRRAGRPLGREMGPTDRLGAPVARPTPSAPLGSPTDHFPSQPTDSEDGSPRGSLRVPGP